MNPAGSRNPETDTDNDGGSAGAGLRRWLTAPLTLALAYAALGLAWILLSDRLLQSITTDTETLAALARGKGMAFVLVTSGLIYLVAVRRQRAHSDAPPPQDRSASLMWVFALLCAAVVIASLVSYSSSAQEAYEQHVGQLRREAQLRADLASGWAERSMQEARQLAADPTLRASLQRWRRHPDDAAAGQLHRQLQMLPASGRYTGALLLDEHAQPLLGAVDDGVPGLDPALTEAALAALRRGRVTHSDFQARADDPASLRFDLFIPLQDDQGRPDAVLVLRAAPRRTLLPQLMAGSAVGSPETLLLRPDAQGLLALGLDASDAPVMHPSGASAPLQASLASLASNPGLAGRVLPGLAHGRENTAAVAMALPDSGWYVAVQLPRSKLQGDGAASGAATLSLVNVLAVLATGAVVYAALRRRELQVASRRAADLQEKERAWKIAEVIANSSTDVIFAKDLQGRYLLANGEMCRLLGRSPEQLIGSEARGLFPIEQVRRFLDDDSAALNSATPVSFETRYTTPHGERVDACTRGRLVDSDGRVIGVYGVSSDVTARRALQQRMRQWSTAFEDMRDGVIVTDAQGRIQSVNRAFTEITGYLAEEAIGTGMKLLQSGRHGKAFYEQMWAMINQTGHWQGEIWNRRKNGQIFPEWLTIRAMRDEHGPVTHYVGVFTDVSRIKDSEAQAEWLFHHDPLTRLPNRAQLQRRLEQVLARARRREARPALLVIALDGFKTVNDSLGHPAGDELLVCVAERLQALLRQKDFIGRLGGDEFLVILENGADSKDVGERAHELLSAVSEPVALTGDQDAYLTASIGICVCAEAEDATAVELLRNADAAMHRAKELGRNRFCFYTGDMHASAMAKLEVEAALSRAIERDELLLHYQPKVDARSGQIVGAEALLRWQRGDAGLVPPGQFIPLAEQSSLILEIGAWVIDSACSQIRAWMDAGQPVVRIAVNVAARQFAAGDLDIVVANALLRHGVAAQHLELELTEGMLMTNPQAGTATLQRLRDLGVKISLDDFGTGYSSLAYLQQFPIDTLKIDQSFVRRIGEVPDGAALVDAIIGLAHRLRLRVVAEGVETPAQREHLLRQHCDEMQGYHFGRPAPAEALQAMLAASAPA
ncbi:putative bifunctional diguanylate cyclase/phosphodiesterase [Roseateles sp.]|uniref:putative bifunctional diguanylate cyclase/phosphodiesterase n=1 Tax=Roseateles sp. TaxID=1971397 RepID=UPI0039EB9A7F